MSHWYEHVAPVSALIPCEGEQHRITWRWGKLKLDDHDLGGERAMLSLGGEANACLRALQLWGDQFGLRPEIMGRMRTHMGDAAALMPAELDVPRKAGMALSLERAWRRSRYFDEQGRMIERQLKDVAVPALRAHLTAEKARVGSRMIRLATVRHVAAGRAHLVEGQMDSVSVSATAQLSSDWIVHVWARGLAVVDGAFVLEATPEASPAVRAVRWQPSDKPGISKPAVVDATAQPAGDGWRLTEGDAAT